MKKLFLTIVCLWAWHVHCTAQLTQFHPGEVWNDAEDAPINAHGAAWCSTMAHTIGLARTYEIRIERRQLLRLHRPV